MSKISTFVKTLESEALDVQGITTSLELLLDPPVIITELSNSTIDTIHTIHSTLLKLIVKHVENQQIIEKVSNVIDFVFVQNNKISTQTWKELGGKLLSSLTQQSATITAFHNLLILISTYTPQYGSKLLGYFMKICSLRSEIKNLILNNSPHQIFTSALIKALNAQFDLQENSVPLLNFIWSCSVNNIQNQQRFGEVDGCFTVFVKGLSMAMASNTIEVLEKTCLVLWTLISCEKNHLLFLSVDRSI